MEEKDSIETNEETRARGVKRTSDIKIAEVTTISKSELRRHQRKPQSPPKLKKSNDEEKQSKEDAKRSRMLEAVKDVAEGRISIEDLTAALNKVVTKKTLRLAVQGAFYNPPEEPSVIELDMAAFNRSARAIAAHK